MAKRRDDVTVRVEVVVGGVRQSTTPPKHKLQMTTIPQPAPARTPVRMAGGTNYICAVGNLTVGTPAKAARVVWAKVYPGLVPLANIPERPDVGAVSCTPQGDGVWRFDRFGHTAAGLPELAHGSELPGAVCDLTGTVADNNTLAVWYDFDDLDGYEIERTPFYVPCPIGSGSGPAMALVPTPSCSVPIPATLFATFVGALAGMGTVTLTWNGTNWAGFASGCGDANLIIFTFDNPGFSLLCLGLTLFTLTSAAPDSCCPYSWTGTGIALGVCTGDFTVTITE